MFMQVYNNDQHSARRPRPTMTITDTQGNVYTPIVPAGDQPVRLPRRRGAGQRPDPAEPDTTPRYGPTQGALLLYKIQVVSLDNRPLELKITNPEDLAESASAELDV